LGENKPQLILLNIENECVLCLIAEFKYRNWNNNFPKILARLYKIRMTPTT
jgi:hypothetical protein